MTDDERTKLSGIDAGAQVNKIESIKVNGTEVKPDSNKEVNITVDASGAAEKAVATHNTSSTAHSDIRTLVSNAQTAADNAQTKANEIEELIVKNGVIDGSPRGVYANLSALQTAYPTGASGVYLTSDNGHWYYWNGSAWTNGGVYHSSEDVKQIKEDLGELDDEFHNAVRYTKGANIFNKDAENSVVIGSWYRDVNNIAVIQEVTAYTAVMVALNDEVSVSLKQAYNNIYNGRYSRLYNYFFVKQDMTIISTLAPNVKIYGGYTIENIPIGSKYLLLNILNYTEAVDAGFELMVNEGIEALNYVPYRTGHYIVDKALSIKPNVTLNVPDSYDVIYNDPNFQLFWKGMLNTPLDECYRVEVSGYVGNANSRSYTLDTTKTRVPSVGSITLTLYDSNNVLVDSKVVDMSYHVAKEPSSEKVVLCVGDSLTTGGIWVEELHRRITKTGGNPSGFGFSNVKFIGNRKRNDANYEGYGGWNFTQYNTANVDTNVKVITCTHDKTEASDQHSIYKDTLGDTWKLETIYDNSIKIIAVSSEGANFPTSGTLTWVSGGINHADIVYENATNGEGNPFWNASENKVDFIAYAESMGVSTIDYLFVLLGWNSITATDEAYKASAQTFINNVHRDYPNAKIVLMGLQIPSVDGIGNNYGTDTPYTAQKMIDHVFRVERIYKELAKENNNVSVLNISNHFDTKYNMPTIEHQVNARNTQIETIQSNGVHPATSGYLQIADVAFRKLIALISG